MAGEFYSKNEAGSISVILRGAITRSSDWFWRDKFSGMRLRGRPRIDLEEVTIEKKSKKIGRRHFGRPSG